MIKNFREIVSGWKHKKMIPFWHDGGDSMIKHLHKAGIKYRNWNDFFGSEGEDLYCLVKNVVFQKMQEAEFRDLTDVQKAMMGAYALKEVMSQLSIETLAEEAETRDAE